MAQTLPNIIYEREDGSATVDSPSSMFKLQFEKNEEYLSNLESRNRFIKKTEQMIRKNDRYSKYIYELKTKKGLNHCQVLPHLTDKDCTIEMHHGPIFTLYDICDIMIDHFIRKGWEVTTFDIADKVLDEHWENRIQVVMLCTTIHNDVHDREIFISTEQAWGNLGEFLKRYKLSPELREKYNRYMDRCQVLDSTAYDRLQLNEKIFERMDKKK